MTTARPRTPLEDARERQLSQARLRALTPRRPLRETLTHFLLQLAICSPVGLVLALLAESNSALKDGIPDVALVALLATFLAWGLAYVVAGWANPSVWDRGDTLEFVQGLMLAPVYLVSTLVGWAIIAFFGVGVAGLLLFGARQLF